MQYGQVEKGIFLARPNRFIAQVLVNGAETVCHVKNTGRCRELLVPGAAVYVEKAANPARKTAYDLIAVEKGSRLINMDAQAPNRVFAEWAQTFDPSVRHIRPEFTFGQSRLDFCLETANGLHLVEVKGVTLEEDGHTRCKASARADARRGAGTPRHRVLRDPDGGCGRLLPERRHPSGLRRRTACGTGGRRRHCGVQLPCVTGSIGDRQACGDQTIKNVQAVRSAHFSIDNR